MYEKLTRKVRVVNGYVAHAIVVKNLELGAIRLGNIGKVLGVVGIYVLGVSLPGLVAKVIPLRSRKGQLGLLDAVRRQKILEVIPLAEVRTPRVLDLAGTDD